MSSAGHFAAMSVNVTMSLKRTVQLSYRSVKRQSCERYIPLSRTVHSLFAVLKHTELVAVTVSLNTTV